MIALFKMAFRDLGRNRRRSFFSALALGIGLGVLLLMASVIAGEMRDSMNAAIKLQSGDLQVQAKSYQADKSSLQWQDLVENPDQVAQKIASMEQVEVATPRLFASAIITDGEESVGVNLIGIDPTSAANAPYQDGMVSGSFLTPDDSQGILIGQPLAEKLKLNIGDQVNLLTNTSNGNVDQQNFIIRGIYSTNTFGYDQSTIFMPLAKAQAITQTDQHASTIFVLLKDRSQTDAVTVALQTDLYKIIPWTTANQLLNSFEDLSNSYMIILYLIVLAITATVIINTLIMSVFERTREIGILSAIGMKSGSIMAMFFIESSMLAIGGIIFGWIIGGMMVYYASVYGFFIGGKMGITGIMIGNTIYGYLRMQDVVSLSITAFIVTLLAGLYPAILAARLEPVQALHGGK